MHNLSVFAANDVELGPTKKKKKIVETVLFTGKNHVDQQAAVN